MRTPNVERVDVDGTRYYRVQEPGREPVLLPSVSTILDVINSPHLVTWAAKVSTEYLRRHLPADRVMEQPRLLELLDQARVQHQVLASEAAAVGTDVHALIEAYVCCQEVCLAGVDRKVRRCVEAFQRWWSASHLTTVATEFPVWNLEVGYAGTLDILAEDAAGAFLILDTKTSTHVSDKWALQVVAYKCALESMNPDTRVGRLIIVKVGRQDGKLRVIEVQPRDFDRLKQVFMAAVSLYTWKTQYQLAGK
jgi:PD-(D/E)XK nuclease superfamily protein